MWILAIALALFLGCGSDSGKPGLPETAELPQIGYGIPNACHLVDSSLLADSLASADLGLTVCEAQPWFTKTGSGCKHNGGLSDDFFPGALSGFVSDMRSRGIVTVLIGVNANNCKVRDTWDLSQFAILNDFVLSLGTEKVWYLPVNEPWTGRSALNSSMNSHARSLWTGTFLVADQKRNHFSGEPYFAVPKDFVTVNACTDEAAYTALESKGKVLVTTDCTGTLNPGPERAAGLARSAKLNGTPLVIYDFRGTTPDQAVISAMGAAIK